MRNIFCTSLYAAWVAVMLTGFTGQPAHAQKLDLGETPEMTARWKRIAEAMAEGRRLLTEKKYEEAIVIFRRVTQEDRNNGNAWVHLAETLALTGKKGMALQAYRTLYFGENGRPIDMAATEVPNAMRAVTFFVRMRYLLEAKTIYQLVARNRPPLLSMGASKPALPDFTDTNPTARQLLAVAPLMQAFERMRHHEFKEALALCDESVSAASETAPAHFYRGYCLKALKRFAEANQAFQRAIYYARGDEDIKLMAERQMVKLP